jgi:hypothetical protein
LSEELALGCEPATLETEPFPLCPPGPALTVSAVRLASATKWASTRPLTRVGRNIAGMAPRSIIAAIIEIHDAAKKVNEPSLVATPTSMPRIWSMATTQHAAAAPRIAVTTTVVAAVPPPGTASDSW